MVKYSDLINYFDKQLAYADKLHTEIVSIDVSIYANQFLFSMRVQQFYTALEDLLKQIAKSFENHIDTIEQFS